MKRRFVVVTVRKGSRLGVVADHFNMAAYGLHFYDERTDAHPTVVTVIAIAPGTWRFFIELAEGEDWPDGLDEVVQFGGEADANPA